MGDLRFAILQQVGEGKERIALERTREDLKNKLGLAVKEQMLAKASLWKKTFTITEIEEMVRSSIDRVIQELHDETVKLV